MMFPSKIVRIEESGIAFASLILAKMEAVESISGLSERMSDEIPTLVEFIIALDLLYVTGRVDVDEESGVVYRAV